MTVKTKENRIYLKHLKYSKGTTNNPFTPEEIKVKFRNLASSLFGEQRIQEIMDCVLNLDQLGDISVLMNLLRK